MWPFRSNEGRRGWRDGDGVYVWAEDWVRISPDRNTLIPELQAFFERIPADAELSLDTRTLQGRVFLDAKWKVRAVIQEGDSHG